MPDRQTLRSRLISALAAFRAAPSVRKKAKARIAAAAFFSNPSVFVFERWFPLWEPRPHYKQRARSAYRRRHADAGDHDLERVDTALEQYLSQREAAVKEFGFPRSQRYYADLDKADRKAMKASELRRFRWLALACAGHQLSQIATSEEVSRDAIRVSNRRTARLLGLP